MPTRGGAQTGNVSPRGRVLLKSMARLQAVVRMIREADRAAGKTGRDIVADGVAGEARQRGDAVGTCFLPMVPARKKNPRMSACRRADHASAAIRDGAGGISGQRNQDHARCRRPERGARGRHPKARMRRLAGNPDPLFKEIHYLKQTAAWSADVHATSPAGRNTSRRAFSKRYKVVSSR